MATHSSILDRESHGQREPVVGWGWGGCAIVHRIARAGHD